MKSLLRVLNKIIDISGYVCIAALILMVCNVFIDVFIRYAVFGLLQHFHLINAIDWYNDNLGWLGGIGMQEMEWHFFSLMFLLGLGYTLRENGHVRVDVFYDNFSRTAQAWINIIGGLIFALPFSLLLLGYTWDFFHDSYVSMENRGDPGSLPRLWPVKFVLPLAFAFLILSIVTVILSELVVIKEEKQKAKINTLGDAS